MNTIEQQIQLQRLFQSEPDVPFFDNQPTKPFWLRSPKDATSYSDLKELFSAWSQMSKPYIFGDFYMPGKPKPWWIKVFDTNVLEQMRKGLNCPVILIDQDSDDALQAGKKVTEFSENWKKKNESTIELFEKVKKEQPAIFQLLQKIGKAEFDSQGNFVQDGLFIGGALPMLIAGKRLSELANSEDDKIKTLLKQTREVLTEDFASFLMQMYKLLESNTPDSKEFQELTKIGENYFASIDKMDYETKTNVRYSIKGLCDAYFSVTPGFSGPEEIAELLEISYDESKNKSILDVGCGTGDLWKNKDELNVTFQDGSPAMLLSGVASGNIKPENNVVVCQANEISKQNIQSVDITTLNFIIDTIPQPKTLISDASLLTKDGGFVVINTPLPIRRKAGGKNIQVEDQKIGDGINPLTDLEAIIELAKAQRLVLQKIQISTYKQTDVGSNGEIEPGDVASFTLVFKKIIS